MGFLNDHYSADHNDADLPEDEELPFKSITFHTIGYAIVPGPMKTNVFVSSPAEKKIIIPEACVPQQHLSSIFHPPRA